jgi:hypothetical protein
VFAQVPSITVLTGSYMELHREGPFALLALDGGGAGEEEEPPIEPADWLCPGGVLVIDDFTPAKGWPPTYAGRPDTARLHWLDHPQLTATEICTQPGAAAIVAMPKS